MIPQIDLISKLYLPKNTNYWFINDNDNIRLLSDAIYTPTIIVNKESYNEDCWIVRKAYNVVEICGKNDEKIIHTNQNAIDFVQVDNKIMPIERKNKNLWFNGEKYYYYDHKYSFHILSNKNKFTIITNNKLIELEVPLKYRIQHNFMSLIYDNYSIVIDNFGNEISFNRSAYYLGDTSLGTIYQTLSGKIITEKEYDLLGICTSDAYLLGESSSGIIIICNNKAKIYYKGGWSYISTVSSLSSSYVNHNFVILTDVNTCVFDGNLKKMFDLQNVHSIIAERKNIYVVSITRKLYLVEPSETEIIEILNSYNSLEKPIIIKVNNKDNYDVILDNKLVKTSEKEINGSLYWYLEPTRFRSDSSYIVIQNELFRLKKEFQYQSMEPEIDLEEGYIIRSLGGKIKGDAEGHNSIIKLKIRYAIPSKLNVKLRIKIRHEEHYVPLNDTKGEISVSIPFSKFDSNEEILTLVIDHNGISETVKEYLLPVNSVSEKGESKSEEYIENVTRRIEVRSESEQFEWVKIYENQEIYDNVIIAKEGSKIQVEDKSTIVRRGKQKIEVEKNNYKREYFVFGLPNPIKNICAKVDGDYLYINFDLLYAIPITVIYGTQIQTSVDGKFIFKADPAYSYVYIIAHYSNDIKWNYKYVLNDFLLTTLKSAYVNSLKLYSKLNDYGIV